VIDGRDVLLTQVSHQFEMMTGKKMPVAPEWADLKRQPAAVCAAELALGSPELSGSAG
jgi:hypothetical protein